MPDPMADPLPGPLQDLRQELLTAFDAEYRDHLASVRSGLAAARRGEAADLRDIFRRLHSLKGAARAVDLPSVEALAHGLEAQMAGIIEAGSGLGRDRIASLEAGLDGIETAIEAAISGTGAAAALTADEPTTGYMRVEAGQVTDLVIATTRLAQAVERQDGLSARVHGIEQAARRARRALEPLLHRDNAPGPLAEVARELGASMRDAALLRHDLRETSWALDEALRRLREDVDRFSLVPAETVFGPMARMLRELARDEGVEVEPDFTGLGLQADRRVLQALKDPVLQLLRNAVSHGGEHADRRRARGRPPAMRIALTLRSGGGRLTVTVTDDGPGPDIAAIRSRAVSRGLLAAAAARGATPEQLFALVFEPGFSTRADVGQLSGRGMGLSIVAEAARALEGSARMSMASGGGAAAEITVPLSIARQTAVLLAFGEDVVALPSAAVQRLLRVPVSAIEPLGGRMCVRTQGGASAGGASAHTAPVAVLGELLAMGQGGAVTGLPVHDGHVKLAVMRGGAGGQALALAVDRFQDVRRFLSHSAEIVGLDTDLVAGFVMIGSETPAPLLSPDGLVARWAHRGGWSGEMSSGPALPDIAPPDGTAGDTAEPRTILVADDSITSRTLEKSILEAHGYRVITAADGLEALEMLQIHRGQGRDTIDMVLADIEMPRMDGFALLEAMKGDPVLSLIPVIIMTSREAAADVRRGLDLGAAAYIAKQTFDQQDLLGVIGRLL
ncbi:response regulator [Acidisoma sp.]|uniref:ATP-binding response regulator n=1 Tax=Acidisoma sp. TaxID=1872115 RepID=UPI003B005A26